MLDKQDSRYALKPSEVQHALSHALAEISALQPTADERG
jgi:hypothetical protein